MANPENVSTTNPSEDQFSSPYRADGKLYGFVCIVTGATSPNGRAIIHELAAHGAACIYACTSLASADNQDYTSLISATAQANPKTKIIAYPSFQASVEDNVLALIDDVLNSWGRLDVYVTTSSLAGPTSLSETGPANLIALFEEHSLAPFFALKYGPAAMAKTMTISGSYPNATPKTGAYGSIVVVSSVASTHGGGWGPGLTVSSHAALGVVRAGVAALKGSGSSVRINIVSAGEGSGVGGKGEGASGPHVDGWGLKRLGVPQEVAKVVGFLASGFSSFVTGSNVIVDAGSSAIHPSTVIS